MEIVFQYICRKCGKSFSPQARAWHVDNKNHADHLLIGAYREKQEELPTLLIHKCDEFVGSGIADLIGWQD